MKIAVIGGNGFLGSEVMRVLWKSGHNVTNITRESYGKNFNKYFDILINCNGNSRKYLANKFPLFDFDANVRATLKSLIHFNYKKYIYISSIDVYHPSIYGIHKSVAEFLLHQYSTLLGFTVCIIRPASIIGKNMTKGVLYDILNDIPIKISPESKLQFITNTEIANFIVKILKFSHKNLTFNLAGNVPLGFPELEQLTNKKIQFDKPPLPLQNYNVSTFLTEALYPLKTSAEYIQDYLSEYKNRE